MKTIRQQLIRKLLVGFALLLALGGAATYFSTREALLEDFDDTLRTRAMAITTLVEHRRPKLKVEVPDRLMHGSEEGDSPVFFELWDTNKTSLERSESLGESHLPFPTGTFQEPEFWNMKLPDGFGGRAVGFAFAPAEDADEGEEGRAAGSGKLLIVVASHRHELDETLATLALVLTGSGSLVLVATALIVPRVLRRELSPLNQLADQASRITADSLAHRFATDGLPGELTPISGRLNDLLARLERAFERERRFSADLAHELRTPIAELRSFAELALKWPATRTAQTDREVLAIAIQMERLVTSLLALLRSERELLPVAKERVPLARLLESVWKTFAEKAAAKQLTCSRHIPDQAIIETDPALLRAILTNLADNAVEYTPHGGRVRIEGGFETGKLSLRVTNTVEQLTPEDVTHLFDRFWRKEAARSNNEHSGLGLSLSRAFAQALGFELTATLDDKSQLTLTLSETAGKLHELPPEVVH
jgi:two-component system sensor histidine kinase QseC